MSESIGMYRGKKIEDMDKPELLEVIKYLVSEMTYWKKQYDDNYDLILNNAIDNLAKKT